MSRESEMRRCAILDAQAQSGRLLRERRMKLSELCSFCRGDGFVGANICQECRGKGHTSPE